MFNNLLYYHTGSPRHTPTRYNGKLLTELGRKLEVWEESGRKMEDHLEVTTVGLVTHRGARQMLRYPDLRVVTKQPET